jgi:hypothetical protein
MSVHGLPSAVELAKALSRDLAHFGVPTGRQSWSEDKLRYYSFCRYALFVLEEQSPTAEFVVQTCARWHAMREQWVAPRSERLKPWNWLRIYLPPAPSSLTDTGPLDRPTSR